MKKAIISITCLLLAILLSACASGTTTEPIPQAQMPNPMVEQQSAAAFEALGIKIDAPEQADSVKYFIIDNALAEVSFTLNGVSYTYRASATDKDISGVYDEFTPAISLSFVRDFDNLSVDVQNASQGGTLASWSVENIFYSLFADKTVDEATIKACVKAVLEKSFTGIEDAVSDFPGYSTFDISSTLIMDIDGDGKQDTITVEKTPGQEYELDKHTIKIKSDSGESSATVDITDYFSGYALDIDGDGVIELFATGNEETCYKMTWLFRYQNGEFIFAKPFYEAEDENDIIAASASGGITDISNGVITIEDTIDILGTWGATTQFKVVNEPFSLVRVPDSAWVRDSQEFDAEFWSYCTMITTKELPVIFEGESTQGALETGVKLAVTASDNETYVDFVTEDGRKGRIAVTKAVDSWEWLINGAPESEYFESIPYAG